MLRDLDEAQCDQLADRWRDGVPINTVALEIIEGYRELSVVHAAVVSKLYFQPVKHTSRRQAQRAERVGLKHLDFAPGELSVN